MDFNIDRSVIDMFIKECLVEGVDKYIVRTMRGNIVLKTYNQVSKHDTIYAKIILTYKDQKLSYKLVKYKYCFQIKNRIKHKNEYGKFVYLILYIPETQEYTFDNVENKLRFKDKNVMKEFFYRYSYFPPEERNYIYGITHLRNNSRIKTY